MAVAGSDSPLFSRTSPLAGRRKGSSRPSSIGGTGDIAEQVGSGAETQSHEE